MRNTLYDSLHKNYDESQCSCCLVLDLHEAFSLSKSGVLRAKNETSHRYMKNNTKIIAQLTNKSISIKQGLPNLIVNVFSMGFYMNHRWVPYFF